MARVVEGELQGQGIKVAIVVSRFNSFITERLLDGALDALRRHGVDDKGIDVFRVPGAFELPLAVRRAAGRKVDAVIALGALIRGGTPHFDYLSAEVTKGVAQVTPKPACPCPSACSPPTRGAGDRTGGDEGGNKGAEAAQSAIEMVNLLRKM
jgi:6,7-dimethyl-8-ribityllumazine synthase